MFFKKKKETEVPPIKEETKVKPEEKWPDDEQCCNMTFKEYKDHLKEDETWAPGWDAIDDNLKKLYGDQEAKHYGTQITSRAIFGGEEYLDGYSFYQSSKGYLHLITYGMSHLYANPAYFKDDFSLWGYEMTMKLKGNVEENVWACNMLGNLARYTFTSGSFFEDHQYVVGAQDSGIKLDSNSKITSLIIIRDPELAPIETVNGPVEFLLMIGVLWEEIEKVRADVSLIDTLLERMKEDGNVDFVTDLDRTTSYL